MSNDVKWTDWTASGSIQPQSVQTGAAGRSRIEFLACVVGLAALAVVLPGPTSWFELLTADGGTETPATDHVSGADGIGATAETAILFTAGIVVWVLLIWILAVTGAAVAGRLPGAAGRRGRALLGAIAPAAAGRIIAAAVGVSLLAGTSACAVPAAAALGSGSTIETIAASSTSATVPSGGGTVAVTSTPTAPAAPSTSEEVIASIAIDWPAPAIASSATAGDPTTVTSVPATTSTATSAAPNTTAPNTTTAITTAPNTTALPFDDASTGAAIDHTQLSVPGVVPTVGAASPSPATPGTDSVSPTDADDSPTETPTSPGTEPRAPRPTAATSTGVPDPLIAAAADSPTVLVLPGDTLWSIAHHHLAPDATDAQIDTAWRAWYSANQQVIGDDPDLIAPGQLLLPPDPETGR